MGAGNSELQRGSLNSTGVELPGVGYGTEDIPAAEAPGTRSTPDRSAPPAAEKLRQPPFGGEVFDDPEQDRANDDGNQDANCECEHDGLPPILAAVFSSLPSAPSVDELKNDQKQNGADGGGGNDRRDVGPKVDNRESRAQIPNITDASTPAMRLRYIRILLAVPLIATDKARRAANPVRFSIIRSIAATTSPVGVCWRSTPGGCRASPVGNK